MNRRAIGIFEADSVLVLSCEVSTDDPQEAVKQLLDHFKLPFDQLLDFIMVESEAPINTRHPDVGIGMTEEERLSLDNWE